MSIGENIRNYRLNKGLTQAELAKKSGMSRIALGNYERGERIPNSAILCRIADALDTSPNELSFDEKQNEFHVRRLMNSLCDMMKQNEANISSLHDDSEDSQEGELNMIMRKISKQESDFKNKRYMKQIEGICNNHNNNKFEKELILDILNNISKLSESDLETILKISKSLVESKLYNESLNKPKPDNEL